MNRLSAASSPYLLQHRENPVDWWEWGDDAFDEAARRDVPVLLSVGYAACHWCHVMAHESFEDEAIAAYMNEHFVSVKVDREERPDVDAVYMEAVQALTGQGGWPMTVFLTPDGKPFYAGTYYPPEPRHGMPSFPQVLAAVNDAWRDRRDAVNDASRQIAERLDGPRASANTSAPTAERMDLAVQRLASTFDAEHGGFGGAPKFPPSMVLEFLLRHHARTGDERSLAMVERTCEQMARGGIYDQLGGGFARYSVDQSWTVPHFEKMLYDNAQLLRVYVHLWRVTGSPLAQRVVRETVEFLLRDLRTPEGAFASAIDADAPDEQTGEPAEGASYVWTPGQLRQVLDPEDAEWAIRLFGVTESGTFEHGTSTLRLPDDPGDWTRYAEVREALLAARERRPQPSCDDKVVAAWNGLAIAALAEAGAVFDEPTWVDAATRCADLLVQLHLDEQGRLRRVSRGGEAGVPSGVLEDYGDVAEGFLTLLKVAGEPAWLSFSEQLLEVILNRFPADGGGFYDTADDATDARLAGVRRPQDPTDNAAPSGWSAATGALLTYSAYTGSTRHREAAEAALGIYDALAAQAPRFGGWGMAVTEALLAGPVEVAVVGRAGDARTGELHRAALRHPSPGAAVVVGDPSDPSAESVPLLRDRPLVDDAPSAYVCRHFVCDRPTSDPTELAAQMSR
ncbi:thioredoxin domain-containing protein [Phytoactinopolyspora halotolerans]|uniref:Thioredoxin domain-containing protein n=1 Tax=Phytoactinopolyspora halotolerans TaxID=1981512 RepID=A0A6L9S447_9ACTN|nr:thioredoxin domain-containing protein [Phytoactinopolyspora halotolerans]NED99808.1 thioredoxin domain-containing protein [Phytoactinopolyspora halotolerans]